MVGAFLSQHALGDITFYFCFLFGQFLFGLKRSASAIRNPANPIKTRWAFFYVNWDVLSVRAAIEGLTIYYPWRHIPLSTLLGWFQIALPAWIQTLVNEGDAGGPIAAVALGYIADSALDGLSMWSKLPAWLSHWIKENIPAAPPATV